MYLEHPSRIKKSTRAERKAQLSCTAYFTSLTPSTIYSFKFASSPSCR